MYDIIYNNSFLLNFLTSFIFLISIFFFCFSDFNINNKSISIFGKLQPIIIFFSLFCFIVFAFNILIYLNIYIYLKEILYFLYFLFFLFWLSFSKKNNLFNLKKFFLSQKEYLIIFFFIAFFLISILPISDADSIAVHQNLANYIFLNGLEFVNLKKDFEFTTMSNSEVLLILSPILKSDNFGSQLNFFSLVIFFIIFYKYNKSFIFFIFSCPLIIFFISTQKLQLFFGILFLLLFILVHQKLIKNKIEIFLFLLLLSFYASGKISYILISLPLFFYFLFLNKKNLKLILFYSIFIFLFFFLPIFLIKYKFFGNPISPFFNNFFNQNNDLLNSFALNLRSSEGWLKGLNLKILLKPFIPLSFSSLSNTLGIIFLFQLLNLNLLKKTKFIPIMIIFLMLLTGQILPRYYFEAFLILSFFYVVQKNIIINFFKFSQSAVVLLLSLGFLFMAYIESNVFFQKDKFMNRFSYSFYNNNELEKLNLKGNILVLNQDRQSLFFKDNIYGSRSIYIKSLINVDKDSAIFSFLNENSINYIIGEQYNLPNCIVLSEIGDIYQKKSIRNFFLNERRKSYNIYSIDTNNCKS